MEETSTPVVKVKKGRAILIKLITYLLVAVVAAGGVYAVAMKKPSLIGLPKNGVEVQKEADTLLTDVEKLIALPADEKPTVATITDVEKLKEQSFFKNASNGDKVLIYTNARKAILYRPNENRIIEVGAVNINQASPAPSAAEFAPILTPKPTAATVSPTPEPSQP